MLAKQQTRFLPHFINQSSQASMHFTLRNALMALAGTCPTLLLWNQLSSTWTLLDLVSASFHANRDYREGCQVHHALDCLLLILECFHQNPDTP